MKLAALLACGACVVFIGCSDSGATSSVIEDDANIPIEGDATGDSNPSDAPGDSMATDTGMAADTGKTDTGSTGDTGTADTGGAAKITCGSSSCDPGTQVCCAGAASSSCIAKAGSCPAATAKYSCTQPSDCTGGQVCCATAAGTGGASCAASCPTTTLCTTKADCKGGKNCNAIFAGIKACI